MFSQQIHASIQHIVCTSSQQICVFNSTEISALLIKKYVSIGHVEKHSQPIKQTSLQPADPYICGQGCNCLSYHLVMDNETCHQKLTMT